MCTYCVHNEQVSLRCVEVEFDSKTSYPSDLLLALFEPAIVLEITWPARQ